MLVLGGVTFCSSSLYRGDSLYIVVGVSKGSISMAVREVKLLCCISCTHTFKHKQYSVVFAVLLYVKSWRLLSYCICKTGLIDSIKV